MGLDNILKLEYISKTVLIFKLVSFTSELYIMKKLRVKTSHLLSQF